MDKRSSENDVETKIELSDTRASKPSYFYDCVFILFINKYFIAIF